MDVRDFKIAEVTNVVSNMDRMMTEDMLGHGENGRTYAIGGGNLVTKEVTLRSKDNPTGVEASAVQREVDIQQVETTNGVEFQHVPYRALQVTRNTDDEIIRIDVGTLKKRSKKG